MRLLTLAFACLATFTLAAQDAFPTDLVLRAYDGSAIKPVAFARAEGPTVVAFWATWCAPCKMELDAYATRYAAWARDLGVQVYAISVDQPRAMAKVRTTVVEKGWPFPVLLDSEQSAMQRLGFQAIPQVFVVAPDGSIVYNHMGFTAGDVEELEAELMKIRKG